MSTICANSVAAIAMPRDGAGFIPIDAVSASADSTFSRFNDLPLEIRTLIWKAAIQPRIVHLESFFLPIYSCCRVRSDREVDELDKNGIPTFFDYPEEYDLTLDKKFVEPNQCEGFRTQCPPPSILSVCRESFGIASKFYTRAFGTLGALPPIWFNFESDILYVDWCEISGETLQPEVVSICSDDLTQVRHLLLDDTGWYGLSEYPEEDVAFVISLFPSLERVCLNMVDRPKCSQLFFQDLAFMDPLSHATKDFWLTADATKYIMPQEVLPFINFSGHDRRRRLDMEELERLKARWTEKGMTPLPVFQIKDKIVTDPYVRAWLIYAEEEAIRVFSQDDSRAAPWEEWGQFSSNTET
ncbi:hypothetical protein G7Y89_g4421 [Cudoniella acicularis]|uniref:2EXR domain-containing protein n=1 Tax=Cudoniella acicularis TaxID=354080 RepID=A0A8H4RPG0_9HELO|nr:hypothetical protein G7Y89_g4421 [Cudoniella acicularis]